MPNRTGQPCANRNEQHALKGGEEEVVEATEYKRERNETEHDVRTAWAVDGDAWAMVGHVCWRGGPRKCRNRVSALINS